MRGNAVLANHTNHDFAEQFYLNRRSKIIMTVKPTATSGRSYFLKESARIGALKLRAEQLGLSHYASLYGDKRYTATWQKLLENEPELEPLSPRLIQKSSTINWKLAIALFIGAMALLCLLKPLYNKALPIHIDIKIQVTGRK